VASPQPGTDYEGPAAVTGEDVIATRYEVLNGHQSWNSPLAKMTWPHIRALGNALQPDIRLVNLGLVLMSARFIRPPVTEIPARNTKDVT
jgi:hypothetical protein